MQLYFWPISYGFTIAFPENFLSFLENLLQQKGFLSLPLPQPFCENFCEKVANSSTSFGIGITLAATTNLVTLLLLESFVQLKCLWRTGRGIFLKKCMLIRVSSWNCSLIPQNRGWKMSKMVPAFPNEKKKKLGWPRPLWDHLYITSAYFWIFLTHPSKGQLILKYPFDVFKSSKKNEIFPGSLP